MNRYVLHLSMSASLALGVAALVSGHAQALAAQGGPPANTAAALPRSSQGTPDLSGYWELRFDSTNLESVALTATRVVASGRDVACEAAEPASPPATRIPAVPPKRNSAPSSTALDPRLIPVFPPLSPQNPSTRA